MKVGIGIDTGGTYTDIVAYDYDEKKVISKAKTLTTKEDLTLCISRSLDSLPAGVLDKAISISLSTTLATNACVEGKGGRAKLVLMGLPQSSLAHIDAGRKYGISLEDTLCINTEGSFDGKVVDEPDWEKVLAENAAFFETAQSLAFSEVNALRNSAVVERHARDYFSEKFDVPIVLASDIASKLNFIERGATAQLNARLLPVISDFVAAVTKVLDERKLDIPVMILRSDGSLMSTVASRSKPVETILSGPAASVIGGRGITSCKDCLIVDIGGTTTDISIVEAGDPVMTDSIRIGGWRTQVRGVFIDTYGLGGDSRVTTIKDKLVLDARRVVPICMLAEEHPKVIDDLEMLVSWNRKTIYPMHEFLFVQKQPSPGMELSDEEKKLLDVLSDGPVMMGDPRIDIYRIKPERLEERGIVMRAGLTPTDVMHVRGDFDRFDKHASELAIRHFANSFYPSKTEEARLAAMERICDQVYALFRQKLHRYILYALMEYRYPEALHAGLDEQMRKLVDIAWEEAVSGKSNPLVNLGFDVDATLIGIGAPTHVFLPEVARLMGAKCMIPQDAEVANAIGTAIANISVEVVVDVDPVYDSGGICEYRIKSADGNKTIVEYDDAMAYAQEMARKDAVDEARSRGALGELKVDTNISERSVDAMYGDTLRLGIKVIGRASGEANV